MISSTEFLQSYALFYFIVKIYIYDMVLLLHELFLSYFSFLTTTTMKYLYWLYSFMNFFSFLTTTTMRYMYWLYFFMNS